MSELVAQSVLSVSERSRFSKLEQTVERGMKTFADVGKALQEIRDERLYRQSHETFETYCRERWGMERTYAHRHIQAAEVAAVLPNGNKLANEAQARELVPLRDKPEQLRAAWEEASSDGAPTAERVREVVQSRTTKATSNPRMEPCPTCGRPMRADKPARGAQ